MAQDVAAGTSASHPLSELTAILTVDASRGPHRWQPRQCPSVLRCCWTQPLEDILYVSGIGGNRKEEVKVEKGRRDEEEL